MYRFTTKNCDPLDFTILESDSMKSLYHAAMRECRGTIGNTSEIDYDALLRNYRDIKSMEGTITEVETGILIAYVYVSPIRCSCTRYIGWKETDNLRKGWQEYCKE